MKVSIEDCCWRATDWLASLDLLQLGSPCQRTAITRDRYKSRPLT